MIDLEKDQEPLLAVPVFNDKKQPWTRKQDTMKKRFKFYGIFLVCFLCVLLLFVSHKIVTSTSLDYDPFQFGRTIQSWNVGNDIERLDSGMIYNTLDYNQTADILNIIKTQRKLIGQEMVDYSYPKGRYNVAANSLADLVPELGGQPVRSVIITTWRSGSTFLGDILNSHPGNYYHYEPLLDYEIIQIRGPPNSLTAVNVLKNLLNCNYTDLNHYLDYGKDHTWLFLHNTRLWEQCQLHPHLCWLPEFLNPFCRLFPFQSMKVVRLRLRLIEELLTDSKLNIRVLLLVRDPRGTLQSRKHRDWCPGNPDCDMPQNLCADLVSDYSAAVYLTKKYPGRLKIMRYEDLSVEPYRHVVNLFQFFGLDFHPAVRLFLDTHTKVDVGGVSSTYRNSKSAPFHWRQDLTHKEVRYIQEHCSPAMKYWGYVKAENATHQKEFNPLTDFELSG